MTAVYPFRGGSQKGVTVVESAIILSVFFMLLFGIMECGRLLNSYHFLSNASRQAARYAMVRGSESGRAASAAEITSYVKNMAPGMDPNAFTVTTTWTPSNDPGDTVRVQIQYVFQSVVPFIPGVTMSSASQMAVQY